MRTFFYSPQFEISELLAERLEDSNNKCIPFFRLGDMIDTIRNSKLYPELIVLDYLSVNHELFNIVTHLYKENINIPFIYFNDPCLTEPTRCNHWKNIIEKAGYIKSKIDFNKLMPFFIKLQNLIESEEIRKYIPLMTPAAKIPHSFIKNIEKLYYIKENSENTINEFRERTNLSNNLFYLLSILHKNRDKELSYDDILNIYVTNNKKISIRSLQTEMSVLRKKIKEDKECSFLIRSSHQRFRYVFYKV